MKLTKRDKVLLYVLALVIILAGGIKFFIIPISQSYNESKIIADEMNMQAKSVELAVDSVEAQKDDSKKAKDEFTDQTKDYCKYMTIKEITDYMNNIIVGKGLVTNSFLATDSERMLGVDSGLDIYTSKMTIEVSGTYGNLRAFINETYENKALLVQYFDIISDGAKLEATDTATMEIEIQLFMYDTRWSE